MGESGLYDVNTNNPQLWTASIIDWSHWLTAAGHPPTTIRTRTCHIGRVAHGMTPTPLDQVTLNDLVSWLGCQRWMPATRRSYRSSIAKFFRWTHQAGITPTNPSLGLPNVPQPHPNPHPVPDNAYEIAHTGADARMRLILRLAAEAGLRCGEVAVVHTNDLVPDLSDWSLIVHGKGSKDRTVPLTPGLAVQIRSAPPGWLFPGADNGHLSARWIGKLVAARLPGIWTMHSLRHRFATRTYAIDRDLLTVQDLLGHASPVTTRAYVKIPSTAARRLVTMADESQLIPISRPHPDHQLSTLPDF